MKKIILLSLFLGVFAVANAQSWQNKYDRTEIINSSDGNVFFEVYKGGKKGLCDTLGKEIIKPLFDRINLFYVNKGIIIVTFGKKEGANNIYGSEIIPPIYDDIRVSSFNNYIKVKENGKEGVYDLSGELIVAPIYDAIDSRDYRDFKKGFIKVKKNGMYGACNLSGEEVAAPIYDEINFNSVRYGYLRVKKNNKSGLLSLSGEEIVPCEYEGVGVSTNGAISVVCADGKWRDYDVKSGKAILNIDELYNNFFEEGHRYFNKQQWKKSMEKYKMAASYMETFSVYYNIGACLFNRCEYDEALQYYTLSLKYKHNQEQARNAQEMIERSQQAQQKKEQRQQDISAAVVETLLGVAGAVISASNGAGEPGDQERQAWMQYKQSGLPGASTISFEDFKKANARAAANGYQVGGNTQSASLSNSANATSTRTTCGICDGTGEVIEQMEMGFDKKICEKCKKEVFMGHIHVPCKGCMGHGYIK